MFTRARINVVPDAREHNSTAANRELMTELAEIGGGRFLDGDPGAWSVEVSRQGSRIIEYGRRSAWDRWWLLGLMLALEWGLRRRWLAGGRTHTAQDRA